MGIKWLHKAKFWHGDSSKIIHISDENIYLYDMDTETNLLLYAEFDMTAYHDIVFAPSGEKIAMHDGHDIYLLDLTEIIAEASCTLVSHYQAASCQP